MQGRHSSGMVVRSSPVLHKARADHVGHNGNGCVAGVLLTSHPCTIQEVPGEELVLQPDGRLVIAGSFTASGDEGSFDFALARYESDSYRA